MAAIPEIRGAALNLLLDELDAQAERLYVGERGRSYWVCQRRHPRHPFRAACLVRFLLQDHMGVSELPGRTRNLSRSGMSVLVRRLFMPGEPMELEVTLPEKPKLYMGGLASFCRYAGQGFHEVGMQLHAAAVEPLFSLDPVTAYERLDWMRGACSGQSMSR